jgi:hypothetical protein
MVALEQGGVYPPHAEIASFAACNTADATAGLSASALAKVWKEYNSSMVRRAYLAVQVPPPRFEAQSAHFNQIVVLDDAIRSNDCWG